MNSNRQSSVYRRYLGSACVQISLCLLTCVSCSTFKRTVEKSDTLAEQTPAEAVKLSPDPKPVSLVKASSSSGTDTQRVHQEAQLQSSRRALRKPLSPAEPARLPELPVKKAIAPEVEAPPAKPLPVGAVESTSPVRKLEPEPEPEPEVMLEGEDVLLEGEDVLLEGEDVLLEGEVPLERADS